MSWHTTGWKLGMLPHAAATSQLCVSFINLHGISGPVPVAAGCEVRGAYGGGQDRRSCLPQRTHPKLSTAKPAAAALSSFGLKAAVVSVYILLCCCMCHIGKQHCALGMSAFVMPRARRRSAAGLDSAALTLCWHSTAAKVVAVLGPTGVALHGVSSTATAGALHLMPCQVLAGAPW